jgi:hypothetical protein
VDDEASAYCGGGNRCNTPGGWVRFIRVQFVGF